MDERVLVLAPRGRDAQVVKSVLGEAGSCCTVCSDVMALTAALSVGAGAALLTEEALSESDTVDLLGWLAAQPNWSDFPVHRAVQQAHRAPGPAGCTAPRGYG